MRPMSYDAASQQLGAEVEGEGEADRNEEGGECRAGREVGEEPK